MTDAWRGIPQGEINPKWITSGLRIWADEQAPGKSGADCALLMGRVAPGSIAIRMLNLALITTAKQEDRFKWDLRRHAAL